MSRRKVIAERLQRAWEESRQRQWDLEDGPGPILVWCFDHPWLVTVGLAAVLTGVLGATFGIPPVSPLALVVVFVAPVPWWLRAERRLHERWLARRST
jgi:hypothetical protein